MESLVLQHVPERTRRVAVVVDSRGLTYVEGSSAKIREALAAEVRSAEGFRPYLKENTLRDDRAFEIPYSQVRFLSIGTSDGAIRCDYVEGSDRKRSFRAGVDDYELRAHAIAVLQEQLTRNGFESKKRRESVWRYAWGQMLVVISIILYSSLTLLAQMDRNGIASRALVWAADILPKKVRGFFLFPGWLAPQLGFNGTLIVTVCLILGCVAYIVRLVSQRPTVFHFNFADQGRSPEAA